MPATGVTNRDKGRRHVGSTVAGMTRSYTRGATVPGVTGCDEGDRHVGATVAGMARSYDIDGGPSGLGNGKLSQWRG